MFRLTIDLAPAATVRIHPSRELARAELLGFFDQTGHAYRVTDASWTHTSYDIVEPRADETARISGRASSTRSADASTPKANKR
jgi:hypothetical protein